MRILHIGNIANNAYNIAKAMRERGIEADCYTDHYRHYISQPEWEDADLDEAPACDDYTPVDWSGCNLHGFKRPEWYMEDKAEAFARALKKSRPARLLRFLSFDQSAPPKATLQEFQQELANAADKGFSGGIEALEKIIFGLMPLDGQFPEAALWRKYLTSEFNRLCSMWHHPVSEIEYHEERQAFLSYFISCYDIVQTYGAFQLLYPALNAPSVPQITFEHGTMREFPFQDSALGRKAILAYKRAFANIITNADAIHNARRMGLNNYVFIPHPVDDGKFRPDPDENFRKSLLDSYDATHIFLAPARQNWALKGNDKIIQAFAKLIKKTGKGPKLLLGGWGQEMERTAALIASLDLREHVAWLPPLPKKMLARHINAADAVLDQFILGAFGTTTPEAMACAKPVLLHYNAADHAWCLPEPPPVINVHAADDIFAALLKIHADPAYAERAGRQCLDWFRRFHSMDIVIERHLELYQKLENAPQTFKINVPPMEKKVMREIRVICFVDASRGGDWDASRWLKGADGKSALEILEGRVRAIHPKCGFAISLNSGQKELREAAERLGWQISLDNPAGELMLAPDMFDPGKFAETGFFYVCSLDEPFIDADQLMAWKFAEFQPSEIVSGENKANPYIPRRVYSRAFIEYRQKLRELFKDHFTPLQGQSIMTRYGIALPPPELEETVARVNLANKDDLAPGVDPLEFSVKGFAQTDQLKLLRESLASAANPRAVNAELNQLEAARKCQELTSFPTYVGLNLTSVCSARCSFCSIQPQEQKFKDSVTLEDIKKMDWLRHVETLSVWGGIGDSLVNREFVPIINYLHEKFPGLKLDLSTNGVLLNEENCEAIARCMSSFNVSLNAATRETWEKLMRSKGFDNICRGIRRIAELRGSKAQPAISMSFVASRDNIHEAPDFVRLAHELGADRVVFFSYVPTTIVGKRDLAPEKSLYLDKQLSDRMLMAAEQRALELGLGFQGPPLFNKKADHIQFGSRALTPAPPCGQPWQTCYLTVDEDGKRQMIFCCSSFYYQIPYDKGALDEENFKKVWNHPAAQYFRATVHKKGANPICGYCCSVDRFNPENKQNLAINEVIQPWFEELDKRHQAGERIEVEEMERSLKKALAQANAS